MFPSVLIDTWLANGTFMHLTGWIWGSCTPMIGKVGGIICSLQYHLRPERSRLSSAMYLQDLCMLPWNGSLSYTAFGNKCSRMFLVIFHLSPHVKVKTWFTTHVTHTLRNRPCQELAFITEWKPTKPIPTYFKKLLSGTHNIKPNKISHQLTLIVPQGKSEFLVTLGTGIRSDQLLSHIWLFATPWIAARRASLSITNSWSSPRLTSIKSVMPSNHLILCHPLLLLPSIFPNIRVFSNELFVSGGQSIGASASTLTMNIQDWFPLGLTDWISLQSKGL